LQLVSSEESKHFVTCVRLSESVSKLMDRWKS
jgi:hypothetical protein